MRISDWSSDVCSSDLKGQRRSTFSYAQSARADTSQWPAVWIVRAEDQPRASALLREVDRKSGVEGKRVSVRVALGGRRIIKKKQKIRQKRHNKVTIVEVLYQHNN